MQYDVELIEKKIIAEDTLAVYFERPGGYEFKAGQYCFLNLADTGFQDERGLRRHLTIASSPLESELLFATRLTGSAFKKTLRKLSGGEKITIEKPLGNFTLPEDTSTPLIFIAGGIGITPFRSMLRYAADALTKHAIMLFYSNRVPETAAFLDELENIAESNEKINLVPTMTNMENSKQVWDGLTGRINPSMIKGNNPEWDRAVYYMAGPPKMVDGVEDIIRKMDIGKEKIHGEKLTGY
ncbi:MAG: FAD-dependent oxidoreductase [Nitrospirota bacterium]